MGDRREMHILDLLIGIFHLFGDRAAQAGDLPSMIKDQVILSQHLGY
jgi:hypothetical protein